MLTKSNKNNFKASFDLSRKILFDRSNLPQYRKHQHDLLEFVADCHLIISHYKAIKHEKLRLHKTLKKAQEVTPCQRCNLSQNDDLSET